MTVIALLLIAGALLLIVAGFKDRNPVEMVKALLAGDHSMGFVR